MLAGDKCQSVSQSAVVSMLDGCSEAFEVQSPQSVTTKAPPNDAAEVATCRLYGSVHLRIQLSVGGGGSGGDAPTPAPAPSQVHSTSP